MAKSILIVGSGARNHAIAEALMRSPGVGRVVFAPGTSGLERRGFETLPVASQDFEGLAEAAMMEEFDWTIIGPNTPLVDGVVDVFQREGLPVFGPSKAAARLEGSKSFARLLMNQLRIPTPKFAICDTADRARHMARSYPWARVFKVDGLAYGHGVRVTMRADEAQEALDAICKDNVYGRGESERLVVEERLDGQEITVFSLTDGVDVVTLGAVRNHPRLYNGEQGPPTRSMGQISEPSEVTEALKEWIEDSILRPTVKAMYERGTPLRGALFVDLMIVGQRALVLDYNVRFGDPATQTLLSSYRGDVASLLESTLPGREGTLRNALSRVERDLRPHVSLVLVAEGYPYKAVRGDRIEWDEAWFQERDDVHLYEDGVRWIQERGEEPERLETTGGRICTVVAVGETLEEARGLAYEAADRVQFRGKHIRTDIGVSP